MCWLESIRRPPSSTRTFRGGLALFCGSGAEGHPCWPACFSRGISERFLSRSALDGTARRFPRRPTAPGLGQTAAAASWPTIKKTRGDNKGRAAAAAVCYYYVCPCMQFFIPNIYKRDAGARGEPEIFSLCARVLQERSRTGRLHADYTLLWKFSPSTHIL